MFDEEIREFFNAFAVLLSIIHDNCIRGSDLVYDPRYKRFCSEYWEQLSTRLSEGETELIKYLNELVVEISKADESERACFAFAICMWLDSKITYELDDYEGMILVVLALAPDGFTVVNSLNDNYEETKIWINPKFQAHNSYDEETHETRSAAIGFSFTGINGALKNISYYRYDGTFRIRNVILNEKDKSEYKNGFLNIAFAPMTDKSLLDLFDTKDVEVTFRGQNNKGWEITFKNPSDFFLERMVNDMKLAGMKNVNILLMPEMLGTSLSCDDGRGFIEWVRKAADNLLLEGYNVPDFIVLPSYWHNRTNTATIVNGRGQVMAVQHKYEPFRDSKEMKIEALAEQTVKEYTIIHMPGVHRVAVTICSDYLGDANNKWSDILCQCLGVTLILIPSFSAGETAFNKTIARYIEYGTTGFWGNCCGAIISKAKEIGCCCIAEINALDRFGDKCACCNSCDGKTACIFVEQIALDLPLAKGTNTNKKHKCQHYLKKE